MKKRLLFICFVTLLFVGFIAVWNYSYQQGIKDSYNINYNYLRSAHPPTAFKSQNQALLPNERAVFARSKLAVEYAKMPNDLLHQRSLDTYYHNRAFNGAPPSIPHPIDQQNLTAASCLKCHKNGGFVSQFKAYAPITPHPQFENCRQCHVVQQTKKVFEKNRFNKVNSPKVGLNSAFKGGPPAIPHTLQLRGNCLACHAGPAAPKEIRVSHPERINCRQCHVLKNNNTSAWTR